MQKIKLPKLAFEASDLSPLLSEESMEYHFGKHHAAYISNLNKLIEGTPHENQSLEEIVLNSNGAIFNNAAQHYNHSMFFLSLSANPKASPTGKLLEAINEQFGSFDTFKEQFTAAAATHFGSGWVWLTVDKNGKLSIVATCNAENPLTRGLQPIMTIDVWEHAYYIDYRNRRPDFIKAFMELLDWAVVEENWNNIK